MYTCIVYRIIFVKEVLGICISSVSDNGVNGNLLAALCVAGMTPPLPNYHT